MKPVYVLLALAFLAALPVWPYSVGEGFAASGWICLLGLVLAGLHLFRTI